MPIENGYWMKKSMWETGAAKGCVFGAIMVGYRSTLVSTVYSAYFTDETINGNCWSSTEYDETLASFRRVRSWDDGIPNDHRFLKTRGLSIRLVKD